MEPQVMVMMCVAPMSLRFFTNVHSATVDPKNFDEASFVDVKNEVCIIPPNSFALARTVEFFPNTAASANYFV